MVLSYGALRSRANVRGPHCKVLQYVHGLLIVSVAGDDSSLNADKWVMAYGSKHYWNQLFWRLPWRTTKAYKPDGKSLCRQPVDGKLFV